MKSSLEIYPKKTIMKLTYSITAKPRADKQKANGTYPIYYFVRVGSYVKKIPSGQAINIKDWDNKNGCLKKSGKKLQLIALFLNQKITGFQEYMLEKQTAGKQITSLLALAYFEENNDMNLFTFWESQLKYWDGIYAPATMKSYYSVLRILKEFNNKLNFNDINLELIEKFDMYLKVTRKNSINGAFVKHKNCKSVLTQAVLKGYIKVNPYKDFKIKSTGVTRKFLTIDEMRNLINFEIPKQTPHLHLVKDLFLFSCFTGLRYSDVMRLKVGDVKPDKNQPKLELIVKKTNKGLKIPLSDEALKIIKTYTSLNDQRPETKVFPYIANPQINRAIKDLLPMAEIDKSLSFHCARHSFACNHIEIGTSIVFIKELLGHASIVQTQVYAKSIESDLFKSMSNLSVRYQQYKNHESNIFPTN